MNNLLEANNLSVYFDSEDGVIKAVDGISFTIKQGETLALVGESGSGKSVSAMSLMRLNEITNGYIASGSIKFCLSNKEMVDIVSLKDVSLQKIRGNEISMIFQEPMTSLNPVLTIGRQISESIELHQKLKKEDAKKNSGDVEFSENSRARKTIQSISTSFFWWNEAARNDSNGIILSSKIINC